MVLERLLPDEWLAQQGDIRYTVANCQILHYSRRDPSTRTISRRMQWRRSVCVHDETKSWSGGAWTRLDFRTFRDGDLLSLADTYPNLLE